MKVNLRNIIAGFTTLVFIIIIAFGGLLIWVRAGNIPQKEAVFNNNVRYIAHRGLSSKYYQNTAEAFLAAAQSNFFFGIETDVWITKDGVWVCCHDNNPFEDPTIKITEISYEEALKLPLSKAKAGINVNDDDDFYLCDYASYLAICKEYGKTPIIEIKYQASQSELDSLLVTTSKHMDVKDVQFISFKKDIVDYFLHKNGLTVQWLVNKNPIAYLGAMREYNFGFSKDIITPILIKSLHSQKRYVNVWTVNDKNEAEMFAKMGADFITTDYILE